MPINPISYLLSKIDSFDNNNKYLNDIVLQIEIKLSCIMLIGKEKDLYDGERKFLILDVLEKSVSNVPDNSRRKHVILDFIKNNDKLCDCNNIMKDIKNMFKQYRKMDSKLRQSLHEMGFSISEDGKHYKLFFKNDPRYMFTISKTSSDIRAGKNITSEIISKIF